MGSLLSGHSILDRDNVIIVDYANTNLTNNEYLYSRKEKTHRIN